MKITQFIIGLVIGVLLGSAISAIAIGVKTPYESLSKDAQSLVLYGYSGGTLVPLHVDSIGRVQIH
jgi:hypothetical protein